MSEKRILKKLDDIFNYCEEIDNHLPKEEQTGYKMLPDIFYIQKEVHKLQQKVEQLEQENINIKQQLLENKISLKDVEYQEKIKLQQKVDELKNLLNILNKGDNNGK